MAKDRRCLDDQSWEVAAMASAETVMAVYSDREDKVLESRMRSKDSCPVWREGAGKVPDGNSPTLYSTSRSVLRGRRGASPLRYSTPARVQRTTARSRRDQASRRPVPPRGIAAGAIRGEDADHPRPRQRGAVPRLRGRGTPCRREA